MEARRTPILDSGAERFFRESDYWKAWSGVPDLTADVPYALAAVRSSDARVLDVPCGRGRLLKLVHRAAPAAALFGLDVSEAMARQVRQDVPYAQVEIGSVYQIPFRDRGFDAVLCHESFMHFDHPRAAIGELCRVARDRVYFSVTTGRQLNTLLRRVGLLGSRDVPHWTYNIEQVRELLPESFRWQIVGAFLAGRKALRFTHSTYLRLHQVIGRRLPQALLRTLGQTLFVYGTRVG